MLALVRFHRLADEVQVRAGPDKGFPVLGVLSMGKEVEFYIKKAGWIYIKEMDSQIEGWITSRSAYDSKRHIDLTAWKNNIFKISTKISSYYDKKKLEIRAFKDTGYYPSLTILQKGRVLYSESLIHSTTKSKIWRV